MEKEIIIEDFDSCDCEFLRLRCSYFSEQYDFILWMDDSGKYNLASLAGIIPNQSDEDREIVILKAQKLIDNYVINSRVVSTIGDNIKLSYLDWLDEGKFDHKIFSSKYSPLHKFTRKHSTVDKLLNVLDDDQDSVIKLKERIAKQSLRIEELENKIKE